MKERIPFVPQYDTVSAAVSGTSQALSVPGSGNPDVDTLDVRYVTSGTAAAFIKFGASGVVVTTGNGLPLPPNTQRLFSFGGYTHVAVIGTDGTLYVTRGQGNI